MSGDFNLTFDIPTVSKAEQLLGRKLADLVADMGSEGGLSLTALRVLVAVGSLDRVARRHGLFEAMIHFPRADALIREHGTAACAIAVGAAMSEFLEELEGRRELADG